MRSMRNSSMRIGGSSEGWRIIPRTMQRRPVVVDEPAIRAALDMGACIEACESAFRAYSSGEAATPAVIHLDVPESSGEVHIKAGHLRGARHFTLKVAGGFPGNAALGIPASDGLVVVFDAATG